MVKFLYKFLQLFPVIIYLFQDAFVHVILIAQAMKSVPSGEILFGAVHVTHELEYSMRIWDVFFFFRQYNHITLMTHLPLPWTRMKVMDARIWGSGVIESQKSALHIYCAITTLGIEGHLSIIIC
jgi:hypothetical protein